MFDAALTLTKIVCTLSDDHDNLVVIFYDITSAVIIVENLQLTGEFTSSVFERYFIIARTNNDFQILDQKMY